MKNNIRRYISASAPRYVLRLAIVESLFQKIDLREPFEFIEVGPGRGDLSTYLTNTYESYGTLFEISEQSIKYIKNRIDSLRNIRIINDRIEKYNKPKKVQLIMAFEVMEHIKNDFKFIETISSCLHTNGVLMISVPAYQRKWSKEDEWAGHYRRYEKTNLIKIFNNNGLEIIDFVEYGFPLLNLIRPLKIAYYGKDVFLAKEQATMRSGIDRRYFDRIPLYCILPIYYPFIKMQKMKIAEGFGDGFVVLAKKIC